MGKLYACAAVAAALLTPAGHAAPTAQEPVQTFRSGVDLMTVDVSAIDTSASFFGPGSFPSARRPFSGGVPGEELRQLDLDVGQRLERAAVWRA